MTIKKYTSYDNDFYKQFSLEHGIEFGDLISLINGSDKPLDNNFTVLNIMEKFIHHISLGNEIKIKSKNTVKYYVSFLNRFKDFISEYHPSLLLKDLNEVIFYNYINKTNTETKKPLSRSSINTYLAILRKLCSFAMENDFIDKNYNYKFKIISTSTLPRYLSIDQINFFFNEINKNENAYLYRTVFLTLLGTGLRVHELTNLKIKDFNENYLTTIGKGDKERNVPVYPLVRKAIINYLNYTGADKFNKNPNGYIFSRKFGNERESPISIRSIQYNFQKISRKIKLDNRLTVHSFRHTFAVNCLKAGMDEVYLGQVLGHTSPNATAIYTKLFPHDLKEIFYKKYPLPLEKVLQELI